MFFLENLQEPLPLLDELLPADAIGGSKPAAVCDVFMPRVLFAPAFKAPSRSARCHNAHVARIDAPVLIPHVRQKAEHILRSGTATVEENQRIFWGRDGTVLTAGPSGLEHQVVKDDLLVPKRVALNS
jgi:hypothetical protein